jgi:DNA-binding Lrp family transcriptional regulator
MTHSLRALHHYFSVYNANKELKDQIRGNVLLTAERLLKIYIKYYQEGKADNYTFQTNNASLSEATFLSPDTIIRHIKKLIKAGIILFKRKNLVPVNARYWFNYTICLNAKLVIFKYKNEEVIVDKPKENVNKIPKDVQKLVDNAKNGVYDNKVPDLPPDLKLLKEKALAFLNFSNCRNLRHIRLLELIEQLEPLEQHVENDCKKFSKIEFFKRLKIFIQPWNKTGTSLQVALAGWVGKFFNNENHLIKKENSGRPGQKKALVDCVQRVVTFSHELLESCASALLSTSTKIHKWCGFQKIYFKNNLLCHGVLNHQNLN